MARRATRVVAIGAAVAVVAVGGYAVADAYDVIPGVLTTAPAPEPWPAFPSLNAPQKTADTNVLADLDPGASAPSASVLGARIEALLGDSRLGKTVAIQILDTATGDNLYSKNATGPVIPASTAKLFTAVAAYSVLGADYTLETSVVQEGGDNKYWLVGGGDMMLAAGKGNPNKVNGYAGLGDLAEETAQALKEADTTSIQLGVDVSKFSGPNVAPGVAASDISSGFLAPLSPVAIDIGQLNHNTAYPPRSATPAQDAVETFAAALRKQGITVNLTATPRTTAAKGEQIASVSSAPMRSIVQFFLEHSDNTITEVVGRVVATEEGKAGSVVEARKAVVDEATSLGVNTKGVSLADCSGLAYGSTVTVTALADLIQHFATSSEPALGEVTSKLPVAGLSGTLIDRYRKTGGSGFVRAKTGSLSGVSSLAGVLVDADRRLLTFAIVSNNGTEWTGPTREAIDDIVNVIRDCGCR